LVLMTILTGSLLFAIRYSLLALRSSERWSLVRLAVSSSCKLLALALSRCVIPTGAKRSGGTCCFCSSCGIALANTVIPEMTILANREHRTAVLLILPTRPWRG
jgi:hypothetical protein